MAAFTLLGSSIDTSAGTHTVTATPAVGDLIVIVAAVTGLSGTDSPTDNQGGTYTAARSTQFSGTTGGLAIHVRNSLISSASSTIFTETGASSTGGGLSVFKLTGMSLAGVSAVRGTGNKTGTSGTAGSTPSVTMSPTPVTANPVIGAVMNGANPAALTPRTGYTEPLDTGYATPTTGVEVMYINSGETSATIAWGATSATAHIDVVVELDSSAPATDTTSFFLMF